MKTNIIAVAGIFLCFAGVNAFGEVRYTVTDLGTLGGHSSGACCINDKGQVTGLAQITSGTYVPFLYSNGVMTGLIYQDGNAGSINDKGQITGYYYNSSLGQSCAFLSSSGAMIDLGPGAGEGINDSGQIVGYSFNSDYPHGEAVFYENGQTEFLGTLGGTKSEAVAINNKGQITGIAETANGQNHAFLYNNGSMIDLGVEGYGCAINSYGQITGEGAFLYSNGAVTYLDVIGNAHGINDKCEITGTGFLSNGYYAFLYSGGTVTDLNTLIDPTCGWILEGGTGINNLGQICGDGINLQGEEHAVLLTPVPEPGIILLLSLGVGLLRRAKWCSGRWA
jgi:probable HAF family extracellular repeat protein